MANFVFNQFGSTLAGNSFLGSFQTLQWNSSITSPSTIKVKLLRGDLAATSSPEDLDNVAAVTSAAAEFDGTNYVVKDLTSRTVTVDDTSNLVKLDSTADITWTALGAGSANVDGILVYWHLSATQSNNIPLLYFDLKAAGLAFNGNGGDVTIAWSSDGLVTLS